MPTASVPRAIWFVVFPGFELLDLGGPLCAFNLAKDFHQAAYEVRVVSVALLQTFAEVREVGDQRFEWLFRPLRVRAAR